MKKPRPILESTRAAPKHSDTLAFALTRALNLDKIGGQPAFLRVSKRGGAAGRGYMENINPNAEIEERLRFETLIADLSSIFVNLPAEDVDHEILEAQRIICEMLRLDLSGLCPPSRKP